MNLRKVILAFLAARYPAAYNIGTIQARVNRCGLLDVSATAEQVRADLVILASEKFRYVDLNPDHVTGTIYWSATDAGLKQWHLDGALLVE
jgi:hypothetical protein